ncbi:MAG: hypothetical protein JMN27_18635 [gamma proteobacterium endosymbiont of Lamellibrachia anaximandri]|nr:hypothetical protein [gamma proteobacterium endosymbiont of Lamellibrachia anaximandri]MBL3535821.1 hypothetical protein [gamma proteobacterium endosymbiont of Lamellibrachia anaximandri]
MAGGITIITSHEAAADSYKKPNPPPKKVNKAKNATTKANSISGSGKKFSPIKTRPKTVDKKANRKQITLLKKRYSPPKNKKSIRDIIRSKFYAEKQANKGEIIYWGKIKGDAKAFTRIVSNRDGLHITDLYKGSLSSGSGTALLVHTLRHHNIHVGKRIAFTGIINPATLKAHRLGIRPEKSLLGHVATNAMRELGLKPKHMKYVKNGDKLNLEITLR